VKVTIVSISLKREFFNWINQLDKKTLTDIDVKLLNIVIEYFDVLAPLGTTGGQRAKKLTDLILQNKDAVSNTLTINGIEQDVKDTHIERIDELEIGPFRGFVSQECFTFDKKYIFLYGPNGSGKSSFFEGLEYALLGDIYEANAKRIPIETYIKNIEKNDAFIPSIYYFDSNRKKQKLPKNHEQYRFSLIEKNRIENFARISATTPNEQKNRIATLFGLDAFSDFVDGFTDNFQYLSINAIKADEFSNANQERNIMKQRLDEINNGLTENNNAIKLLIKEVDENNITDKNDLELFLNGPDGTSGKINQLLQEQAKNIPKNLNIELIDDVANGISTLILNTTNLNADLNNLNEYASILNYKDLYSAIVAIADNESANNDVCPACKTPIKNAVINPFVNAKNELVKLKDLAILQEKIPKSARELELQIRTINENIDKIKEYLLIMEHTDILGKFSEIQFIDITSIPTWIDKLIDEIDGKREEIKKYHDIKESLKQYNNALEKQREKQININSEIQKYMAFNNRLIELNTGEKHLKDEVEQINTFLINFDKNNEQKIKEIEEEKIQIAENKKYLESYNKLIFSLKKYRNDLPSVFSTGLSDKVRDYYNIINLCDSDFERLANVALPSASGEKIMIQFLNSGDTYDALYVLSEGHIRVLGLSILLAKAVAENLEFILFDDIVNAIDDDHRSGIAELLMTHQDFIDREQIITCHGEMFIRILENKLGTRRTQKEVAHYRFYPADLNGSRGIKFSTGNSTHYLVQAQQHFERNELKEVASKCRQAVESIAESLWKKIGKHFKSDLSVTMRYPDSKPDLSSVVDSLIKKLEKIDNNSDIYSLLTKLKGQYMWNLLNKGTHEEESLPEFERTDVSNLLNLVKSIEEKVNLFDIKTKVKTI
jgi:energy-coupling factor transporter ATP-binding protein EcfA2